MIVLLLALSSAALGIQAQTATSLQRMTVTSVTLILDSVKTQADMELVRTHIQSFKQVQDFDIKMKNCNFTMDNSGNVLPQILNELKAYKQPATVYAVRANEIFTRVAEESCDAQKRNIPNMTEEEAKRRGDVRKGGQ
jgi:peptidoglycan/xylan/chitin deacetylase (PgdA/CDA1 family)